MLRILASIAIVGLLGLDLWMPNTSLGRRGPEALQRSDIEAPGIRVGEALPPLALRDLEGRPLSTADFAGYPLLITFERSVDW